MSGEKPKATSLSKFENAYHVLSTGASLPTRVVSNAEVAEKLGIEESWIVPRTGISERRYLAQGESTRSMVLAAAKQALEAAGVQRSQVGVVIVATSTPDRLTPSTAVSIQQDLGLTSAWAFDVSAGCSGFLYALKVASDILLQSPMPYALVIGAESLSRHIDWKDSKASALFGDGAGAVVIKSAKSDASSKKTFTLNSASDDQEFLSIGTKNAYEDMNFLFSMNGREVFRRAVTCIAESATSIMGALNLQRSDIKYFICHQANQRILDSVNEKLKFSTEQVPVNINRLGNTGAASIPILLHELHASGKIARGDTLLFSAFGSGFTWGSAVLRW